MIVVTGASGALGQLVVEGLLEKVPAAQIVAAVRDPAKAAHLAARGVQVRRADYTDPASLDSAFAGADRVLLVSANEVGKRVAQHRAVVDAAKRAGVKLLAYTSILRADSSPLRLAEEHVTTEAAIRDSGLAYSLLRNGWYFENFNSRIAGAAQRGEMVGSAGEGRISAAARADYAAAAVAVLTAEAPQQVYELAGSTSFSLAELTAEAARQAGKPAVYRDLPQADFAGVLAGAGVPAPWPELLADSDAGSARGGLFDDGKALEKLIGRPTRSVSQAVEAALSA
ncbi:NmrA family NAD(P)-binding protein [Duganella sp. Root1480D1]|uniref:NmrA family NAD(P)-binding protein n=1 Tax=Duganella sp. Root1480D1 TaxID=1736471 RepID=UPI00070A8E17|nr:NmrA family NAD(P)-binding protein [Duganella sp. Root1480D1]KQZ43984.1 NAD(P)-dependent oxidoreductase [Duganella sp. Root1480D1]